MLFPECFPAAVLTRSLKNENKNIEMTGIKCKETSERWLASQRPLLCCIRTPCFIGVIASCLSWTDFDSCSQEICRAVGQGGVQVNQQQPHSERLCKRWHKPEELSERVNQLCSGRFSGKPSTLHYSMGKAMETERQERERGRHCEVVKITM